MYNVTDNYKIAMRKPVQKRRISGTVGEIPFSEIHILKGSCEITNQITDSSAIALGGVFIGQLKITFLSNFSLQRGEWQGQIITLTDELLVEGNNVWEAVPLGTFTVAEATWSAEGISITAYDNMQKFESVCTLDATSGSVYDLLSLACTNCNVEFGMSEEEVEALTNGSYNLALYAENDVETWRDYISWLAQATCCFATINRNGALVLREFGVSNVDQIPPALRFTGGNFSDFSSFYTSISVVNAETNTVSYYTERVDAGLHMSLGANPFLQYGLDVTVEMQRKNILHKLATFKAVPFSISMLGDPAYDLGDSIIFSSGIAGAESYGCIMFYNYKFGENFSIAGYGENPKLASAKTKTDREMTAVNSKIEGATVTYYQYANAEELEFGEYRTKVASIRFSAEKQTDVAVWHEFKLNTIFNENSTRIKCFVEYYLNGQLQNYAPVETWACDDFHILGLQYHIKNLPADQYSVWEVFLRFEGGVATADSGDCCVVLAGQGMNRENSFSGIIDVEDYIQICSITTLNIQAFSANVELSLTEDERFSFSTLINEQAVSAVEELSFNDILLLDTHFLDCVNRASALPEIYSGSEIPLL